MASITQSYDRQGEHIGWQAAIRKKGYPAQYKTFRTKKEAEAWAIITEAEMTRGVWRDRSEAESTPLTEALDRYRREVLDRKKGGGYREAGFIRQWQARPIASRFLASIRGKDIAEAIREMQGEGKGENTVRLHLALMSHLFNVAKKEWGMESLDNPVQLARKPKLPRGRDRRLMGDEEARLLEACREARNPWLLPVVRFAVETAMRAGEMMETMGKVDLETGVRPVLSTGLLWEHVDLAGKTAFLPETKNGAARTVPLSSAAVEILRGLPRSQDSRVFGTTYEAIHLAFARARKRAGIEDFRFHDLRHEAASRFSEKGLNPMQVAAITGHKTLQMLKRYTHLRAEDLAKLLD